MKINWLSSLLISAFLTSASLSPANSFAQVQAKAPEQNKTDSPKLDDKSDQKQNDKNSTKKPAQTKPSGTFNPTEEISEDLSVSFPVDI